MRERKACKKEAGTCLVTHGALTLLGVQGGGYKGTPLGTLTSRLSPAWLAVYSCLESSWRPVDTFCSSPFLFRPIWVWIPLTFLWGWACNPGVVMGSDLYDLFIQAPTQGKNALPLPAPLTASQ